MKRSKDREAAPPYKASPSLIRHHPHSQGTTTPPYRRDAAQGLSPEEMTAVKKRASELKVERDVTEMRVHPLLERRNGLTYGRLFLDRSASSFEV